MGEIGGCNIIPVCLHTDAESRFAYNILSVSTAPITPSLLYSALAGHSTPIYIFHSQPETIYVCRESNVLNQAPTMLHIKFQVILIRNEGVTAFLGFHISITFMYVLIWVYYVIVTIVR